MKMDIRPETCQKCDRPYIALDRPDAFHSPTEMFAKKLVNSPVEFGTASLQVEADEEAQKGVGRAMWVYDIDVAMHPYHGALVCGAVGAQPGGVAGELETIVEQVCDERDVLTEALADTHELGHQTLPVGAFVVLIDAEASDVPDHLDVDDVWICPSSKMDAISEEMVEAMDRFADGAERPFYEYGPRFVATVRAQAAYKSALEWLVSFETI